MKYNEIQTWMKINVPKSLKVKFERKLNQGIHISYLNLYSLRAALQKVKRDIEFDEEVKENKFMKSKKQEFYSKLIINGSVQDLYDSPERKRNSQYLNYFNKWKKK